MRSWLKHISGATALIELRGKQQLDSQLGLRLFSHLRSQIIAHCLQTRNPVPPTILELSELCRHKQEDPADATTDILAEFCRLRAKNAFHPLPSQSRLTTINIISRAISIANALESWHAKLPSKFLPSTVATDRPSPEVLSDQYLIYPDLSAATLLNNHHTNRLLVHETILSQLAYLQRKYPAQKSIPGDSSSTTQVHIWTQVDKSKNAILNLVDSICASVPFHLNHSFYFPTATRPHAAAGNVLIWPLYVCAQISPRTAPVSDVTRSWIISRLQKIEAETGVGQAMTLAEILKERIEVTELLVGYDTDDAEKVGDGAWRPLHEKETARVVLF